MKFATYQDGSRDGQLLVVSRDLSQACYATHSANRLQQVLDDWNYLSPQLQDVYDALNAGRARHAFGFEPARCMAPLPRAYQWVGVGDGLLPQAPEPRPSGAAPRMYQAASDDLQGALAPVVVASEDLGVDFGAEVAAITGDIPQGCPADKALDGVRLLLLANRAHLRALQAEELQQGCGLLQSTPVTACSPVAATPDELGEAWSQGRVHLPLYSIWNGRKVGMGEAAAGMAHGFGQLIAHLALTRRVRAGAIIGAGCGGPTGVENTGRTEWPQGYRCIADKRAMETRQDGQPTTGYMRFGDTIRIEMQGLDGQSIFGAIEQIITPLQQAQGQRS